MRTKLTFALLICASYGSALAENIVVNPEFLTRDLSGWTTAAPPNNWWNDASNPNLSGIYNATTDCRGTACLTRSDPGESYLYQDLPTNPGSMYTLTFWYTGGVAESGPATLDVYWAGVPAYHNVTGSGHFDIEVTVPDLVAAGTSTRLQFDAWAGENDVIHLERVEVEAAVPEPATLALVGCALISLSLIRRRGSSSPSASEP